ncbi:kappa-type opioid receptor-like [Antedon mediterranea]|uniref:kappa-type opioid receptor-like n=1 Tax=Antedon mediterranea TaxID=105859 RepID=UPI003AF53C97
MEIRIFYCIVSSFGCLINGFAIFIILHLKNWKSSTNLLIFHQSIIDLVTSLLSLCLFLDPKIMTHLPNSEFGADLICKIWSSKYLFWSSIYASTGNLVVLTIDRYISVIHPVKYGILKEKARKKLLLILLIPWICGFGIQMLWLIAHTVKDGKCTLTWPKNGVKEATGILAFVYILLIPITTMIFVYVKIFRLLRRPVGEDLSSALSDKQISIIKTLVVVSVIYAICWIPDIIAFMISTLSGKIHATGKAIYITTFITLINMCVNPIIYTFQYNDFKEGVQRYFPRLYNIMTPMQIRSRSVDFTQESGDTSNKQ